MTADPRIYYFEFPTQYLAGATFLRFTEHYESPKFAEKIFGLEEYMDWQASQKGPFTYKRVFSTKVNEKDHKYEKSFTYFTDWAGFNIPSYAFKAFMDGKFHPLTRKEQALVDFLRTVPEPYYVIATYKPEGKQAASAIATMAHEVVHGLYYLHEDYQRNVIDVACSRRHEKVVASMSKVLIDIGYRDKVVLDEINAYATTGWSSDADWMLKLRLIPLRWELQRTFRQKFDIDLSKEANFKQLEKFVKKIPYEQIEVKW